MTPPSMTFRPAEPTRDDGLAFARYLDQAAEGFFRFLLGRRVEEILVTGFVEPGHDLSYENVVFANRNGETVGMVSSYTAERHHAASDRPLREAAGRWNVRFALVSTLCAPIFRIIDSVEAGDYYVQSVAVDPEARGGGVGTALMDLAEERGRAAGSRRLALDVAATNEGARRLYERRGMAEISRWPKRIRIEKLTFIRMAKPLESPAH